MTGSRRKEAKAVSLAVRGVIHRRDGKVPDVRFRSGPAADKARQTLRPALPNEQSVNLCDKLTNWQTPGLGCHVVSIGFDTGHSFSADFNIGK
jgi:hypothetical protein